MSLKDKEKWDTKYLEKSQLLRPRQASKNLQDNIVHCKGTKALDLACGSGRNSIFLAECGFEVDAFDIAEAAIKALEADARTRNLLSKINATQVDLDTHNIKENYYDIIVMANFLDRKVLASAMNALKKYGVLFVETYMLSDENEKQSDTNNLLKSQELREMLDDSWEVLYYDEFENEDYEIYKMKKQALLAKKIN
ncbi:tellurite resistance protein TehB [Sulfurimonas gotlandica GD1]|jgi:tellurite methyltransferase|uniref:Tellurite resistance protein TehB n=1 Tax=Sulfurimonas gotlandica (strain DSM 19862 / JCM 16533 / GD1) TaxID=929558 RepID=B6BJV2_SULGG|nr:methyltransferase domain-containing protein [Sulfurimonas gotlandica]EDZ62513.1 tellurite resistance protein TehB [Sulfurimonas gotlandica GD1]EHP31352.1 tellurite resistance protein TehB [Sulfurimonas gotlandica GD1]